MKTTNKTPRSGGSVGSDAITGFRALHGGDKDTCGSARSLRPPLGFGFRSETLRVGSVIRHEQTGLLIDPRRGVIYGRKGGPIGAVCADGCVRLGGSLNGYLYAHRVVWKTINGPIPIGMEIDHVNGNKTDNRIGNLDLVTRLQNVQRALATGLTPVGEQRSEAKLTGSVVEEIRNSASKISNAEWARRLGVDRSTIRLARSGKSWRHVPLRGRVQRSRATSHRRVKHSSTPHRA